MHPKRIVICKLHRITLNWACYTLNEALLLKIGPYFLLQEIVLKFQNNNKTLIGTHAVSILPTRRILTSFYLEILILSRILWQLISFDR